LKQLPVVLDELIGGDEPFDPQPRLAGRGAQESHRRVAHLVAAPHVERALCSEARFHRTGVVLPLGPRVELSSVLPEPCRSVFLRIDRDRHEVHPLPIRAELVIELRQDLAHQRANGAAGGKDEIQHHRSPIIDLLGKEDHFAVVAHETDGWDGIP